MPTKSLRSNLEIIHKKENKRKGALVKTKIEFNQPICVSEDWKSEHSHNKAMTRYNQTDRRYRNESKEKII